MYYRVGPKQKCQGRSSGDCRVGGTGGGSGGSPRGRKGMVFTKEGRQRTPHSPVTESHRGPASHPRTVRVHREQTCKEVIPREAEVRRQLCVVAAEGPAAGEGDLQADQVSCQE